MAGFEVTTEEKDHSKVQMALAAYLYARRKEFGIQVFPEQRVQINATRYRVPDICVTIGEPDEQIFRTPLEWAPILRQPVKTQFSLNGEGSHEDVSKAVHKGIQRSRREATGTGSLPGRSGAGL